MTTEVDELRRRAEQSWRDDKPAMALEAAWTAFELASERPAVRRLLVRLLNNYSAHLAGGRIAEYHALLTHQDVEPDLISTAGWIYCLRNLDDGNVQNDAAYERLGESFERDELTITLLQESPVYHLPAERLLTGLRGWLLLNGTWQRCPAIVAALSKQMALNGGAWPFDDAERDALARPENSEVIPAYLPVRAGIGQTVATQSHDLVTARVAAQYESWPYPPWTRITVGEPRTLPGAIAEMDAGLARDLPVNADMLVAGCGTGRQAASVATRFPDAEVIAIDISAASLDYARQRCSALGIRNVRFMQLDLHDTGQLGRRFHAIFSAGVLHHLPNPERGFQVLADALHPGGIMHIMVYNRLHRLMVSAARTAVADLAREPISDDLLRKVRQRLLSDETAPVILKVIRSRDFATLAGTYDLILHRHEDSFDITRVERALDGAGLRLLRFDMPSPAVAARYEAECPADPQHRSLASWMRFTQGDASIMTRHFRFWCGKNTH